MSRSHRDFLGHELLGSEFFDFHDLHLQHPNLVILLQSELFVLLQLLYKPLSIHLRRQVVLLDGFEGLGAVFEAEFSVKESGNCEGGNGVVSD